MADRLLTAVLQGRTTERPPIWLMRQAGRYLPEYRETRAQAGSFLDLCYNSELAEEVTLQPIRRYGFDAAILFADILLIPHALGQDVRFETGEGPVLSPTVDAAGLAQLSPLRLHEHLSPVYETVRRLRASLPTETALIGFAGAPWTVATYMIAGRGGGDASALRSLAYNDDDRRFLTALLDLLTEATIDYLVAQVDAGADAVQLFDTWAGGLPEEVLALVSVDPLARIAAGVKAAKPGTPVILFAKGVGPAALKYAALDDCDGVGIDFATPWPWAREALSPLATVQGGLDPMLIVKGGGPMENAARRLLETFRGTPYIFNAGHGLTPDTPPEHVARLVDIVRETA